MSKSLVTALALIAGTAQANDALLLDKNTIVLRGEVSAESVGKISMQLMQADGPNVTMFFSSPGGSVIDGAALLQVMKASGKRLTCVTDFSASMSFVLMQACAERVVMSNTIMMSHPMSYGVRGQQEYQVDSFVSLIKSIGRDIDEMQAKRIGISVAKLKSDSRNDMWLFGQQAVDYGAADVVKDVTCAKEVAMSNYEEEVQVFIFKVKVTWSSCPLIASPLKVEMPQGITQEAEQKFMSNFVNFRTTREVIRN